MSRRFLSSHGLDHSGASQLTTPNIYHFPSRIRQRQQAGLMAKPWQTSSSEPAVKAHLQIFLSFASFFHILNLYLSLVLTRWCQLKQETSAKKMKKHKQGASSQLYCRRWAACQTLLQGYANTFTLLYQQPKYNCSCKATSARSGPFLRRMAANTLHNRTWRSLP